LLAILLEDGSLHRPSITLGRQPGDSEAVELLYVHALDRRHDCTTTDQISPVEIALVLWPGGSLRSGVARRRQSSLRTFVLSRGLLVHLIRSNQNGSWCNFDSSKSFSGRPNAAREVHEPAQTTHLARFSELQSCARVSSFATSV
jgi:hypothetical protein